MDTRLRYHFEPQRGWMNDPNGLVYFAGQYHIFYQHRPDTLVPEGPVCWGHAVSDDLIHWEHRPIALHPDQPYEDKGGCYSGSAIVKDGVLYLFYTAVSHARGQTQCVAVSRDGRHFEKYAGNPLLPRAPHGGYDFRDPKVVCFDGVYYMVVGSGWQGTGQVLLYRSDDLLAWNYVGVLYEDAPGSKVCECPDFFRLGDTYVLMYSRIGVSRYATQFVCGAFDGERLTPQAVSTPEAGPEFYAPQTFEDPQGRRLLLAWLYRWGRPADPGAVSVGALTIPREVGLRGGQVVTFPVAEARHLLTGSDALVTVTDGGVTLATSQLSAPLRYDGPVARVDILRDTKTIEVFINGGEVSFSHWCGPGDPRCV